MTRWLTDTEQETWRHYLEAWRQLDVTMDQRLQQRSGLTLTDYIILVTLSESDGRQIRMNELADLVVVSRSRLTYRIDALVRRGFIDRTTCEDDRRGLFATLTDEGLAALEAAAPGHVEDVRQLLFDNIEPDEAEAFSAVVSRVSTTIRDLN